MKYLFLLVVICLPIVSLSQETDKNYMFDSTENAVLRSLRVFPLSSKNAELIAIDASNNGGQVLTFKTHTENSHSYDYEKFFFSATHKCYSWSVTSDLQYLGIIMGLMQETGYEKLPNDIMYQSKFNILVKIDYDLPNKTYTMTCTRGQPKK